MLKQLLLTALAVGSLGVINAQTILEENFETGNTGGQLRPVTATPGWTTVDSYSGKTQKYNWHNYYTSTTDMNVVTTGHNCWAAVDAPFGLSEDGDGTGPREEVLLSPELNLDDTYQLEFTWFVGPTNSDDRDRYDIQVRVVTDDNMDGAETVFSIQNEKMLRESGVSVFPIETWDHFTSRVDLSDFKGEKVKLAFVYKMYNPTANIACIDDVTVKKFTPPTGPVGRLTLDRYNFGQVYIGERMYSDNITLTNIGKDGLRITGIDAPEGVSTTLDPTGLNLDTYQSVDFRICYNAQLATPASGNVVLHTSGGDLTIAFQAEKNLIPEGAMYEGFESYFPPAGWKAKGWGWSNGGFEGDHAASGSGDFSVSWLQTPMLDLYDGGNVTFTYYNSYDGDYAPEYDIELQLSIDNGDSWTSVWKTDINNLNSLQTVTVELPRGTEESLLRWYYPAVESDDEGAFDHSSFLLDRVILPNVVGMNGTPGKATILAPANLAENVWPENVELTWEPALFAKGYKLYVGTSAACNELYDGTDIGNVLHFNLGDLAFETEYRWRIVGYNDAGDCPNPTTWRFTTQKNAQIVEFPYSEDFMDSELPLGWHSTPSADNYGREWYVNNIYNYEEDGKQYGAVTSFWLNAGLSNSLETPEVVLPADKPMAISFVWGDEHPADLKSDPSGLAVKKNVEPNNGICDLRFQVYADGQWATLDHLSEDKSDSDAIHYWVPESFDLSTYAGQKVRFRWVHESFSGRDEGQSIARVKIEEVLGSRVSFNKSSWDAGKVNYRMAVSSGDVFTMFNQGTDPLVVKSVAFSAPGFGSSLKAGDRIEPRDHMTFSIDFSAVEPNQEISDVMTITFESGLEAKLPVTATSLGENTYYYSFEPNEFDYNWEEDFTMIDADKGSGYSFSARHIYYSADGQRCAFSLENDSKEHGMYGMMSPISGIHALVAASPQNFNADNWIIWKRMTALDNASFDFYARNWESNQSVLPDPKHYVTVLVSTAGNTNTKDFETVMRATEMPFCDYGGYNHYTVDLSAYIGQDIYVALRHTTLSPSNLAFFDDFTFSGFKNPETGVEAPEVEFSADALVEAYSVSGVLMASGRGLDTLSDLDRGIYIVRVSEGENIKVFRIRL